jgi:phage protein U
MKSFKFIVFGAIALTATSAFADLKSDWQKVLDKYVALNKKRDIKGFDALVMKTFTEDFKFTGKDKKQTMTRQQWIDESHQEMKMTGKITKVVFHADSIKMMGKDKALCKVSIVFEGEVQLDKGKLSKMTSTAKTDQVIVKKGGMWMLQSMTNTEETILVNGKPMKG